MKRCPHCNRAYLDESINFCLDDGSPLLSTSEIAEADTMRNNQNNIPTLPLSSVAGVTSLQPDIQAKRDAYDIEIFRRSDAIFNEDQLDRGLSTLLTDHSYRDNFLLALYEFCDFFNRVQNHYINTNLVNLSLDYVAALRELENFLAYNFFDYPENQTRENIRYCLHPYLSIDRGGGMKKEDMAEYNEHAEKLRVVVNKASVAFGTYRRAVKETLFV